MKLGLDIGYSGARLDLPMEAILRAEALGFDSIWTAESYGSDVFSPLAFIAARTSRIRLCSGIAQPSAPTPANCAMVAQTIDALAGAGRLAVGLGVSGPQIVEGWYGQPWGKPSARLRDYVEIMLRIWRREGPVSYAGSEISLPYAGPGATGLGKPLKSILHGNPDIQIYLGTSTPGNIRLTGEIADGWLSMHLTPGKLGAKLKLLEEGLARRSDGRTIETMEIAGNVRVIVTDDVRAALDSAKATIALYVGGMGAQQKNFHKDAMVERGYGEAAERIQELFLAGRKDEALTAVPDEYIDEGALIGTAARIADRFKAWRDAGFTVLRIGNPDLASMEAIARIASG